MNAIPWIIALAAAAFAWSRRPAAAAQATATAAASTAVAPPPPVVAPPPTLSTPDPLGAAVAPPVAPTEDPRAAAARRSAAAAREAQAATARARQAQAAAAEHAASEAMRTGDPILQMLSANSLSAGWPSIATELRTSATDDAIAGGDMAVLVRVAEELIRVGETGLASRVQAVLDAQGANTAGALQSLGM